jgi:thiamine phosphate synthase YjbQ (UPF0047 family)
MPLLVLVKWSYSTVQHTSASLTINENYDSDVQADTEAFLSRIVPEVNDMIYIYIYIYYSIHREIITILL